MEKVEEVKEEVVEKLETIGNDESEKFIAEVKSSVYTDFDMDRSTKTLNTLTTS